MGTLNGSDVFGYATTFTPSFEPTAEQVNSFFGVNGMSSLHGGERGFVLMVSGVLFHQTRAGVVAAEDVLLSYRDGQARVLVDNFGTPYGNVVFNGAYQRWEYGIKPAFLPALGVGGYALAYKAVLRGLGGGE